MARMVAVSGIGPWTAEVYLLFAAGHPDIFPARDVALQTAVGHALGMETRPGEKALIAHRQIMAPVARRRVAPVLGLLPHDQGQGCRSDGLNAPKKLRNRGILPAF